MSGGPEPGIYHERQRLELCAVHALNNVLQERLFTQEAADEICKRLAPDARLNPHRSVLGTGNYDVNVIMAALHSLDLAAVWWDKRRPLEQLVLSRIHGFIVNVPSNVALGFVTLPVRRKHWIAVRQVGGVYYNLDSKLKAPDCVGGESELRGVQEEMTDGLENMGCEGRMKELALFSLQRRRPRQDMMAVFKYLKGCLEEGGKIVPLGLRGQDKKQWASTAAREV